MVARTPEEKLIARWIEPNPHKPGPAEDWVLPQVVSVWALIWQLQLDKWQIQLVAEDYDLPVEAVEAAVVFYHRHKTEVDARIARNRAVFDC